MSERNGFFSMKQAKVLFQHRPPLSGLPVYLNPSGEERCVTEVGHCDFDDAIDLGPVTKWVRTEPWAHIFSGGQ